MFILKELSDIKPGFDHYAEKNMILWALASPAGGHTHLFAVVSDRGQDGPEGLEAHGDVQQVSSKEEVIKVAKNGHGGVPDQIQEVLQQEKLKK